MKELRLREAKQPIQGHTARKPQAGFKLDSDSKRLVCKRMSNLILDSDQGVSPPGGIRAGNSKSTEQGLEVAAEGSGGPDPWGPRHIPVCLLLHELNYLTSLSFPSPKLYLPLNLLSRTKAWGGGGFPATSL